MMTSEEKNVLDLFRNTARDVPAYRDFLKRAGVRPQKIRMIEDFESIPPIDKANYLSRYSLKEVVPSGVFPPLLYSSSGSSGRPRFWFRGRNLERQGADLHENIIRDIFKIKKTEPTLVVICYSMGVWVAGGFTLDALRVVADRGYRLSIATPGMERADIYSVLGLAAKNFKNVILVGYPSFLMDIVVGLKKRNIRLGPSRVGFLTAGDKITEKWREDLLNEIDGGILPSGVVSMYGSADAGPLGHETPLSIFLRKEAERNTDLRNELFGDVDTPPSFMQYHPGHVFFEKCGREFLISIRAGVPLVRYNMHDWGELFTHKEVFTIIRRHGLLGRAKKAGLLKWRLPFVALKGRTDVAVTFYALNIFPEHLRTAIAKGVGMRFFDGSFSAYNRTSADNKVERLYIRVGLRPGARPNAATKEKMTENIVKELCRCNIEFRKLYSTIGKRAIPAVHFIESGGELSPPAGSRGLIAPYNKKSRMIL